MSAMRTFLKPLAAIGFLVAALGFSAATPALAQAAANGADPALAEVSPEHPLTPEQVTQFREVWKKADCTNCHGWSGNGHDTGPVPPGPSLRDLSYDFATIREVAQCGRPGTNMPSHDRLAYTDDRCYGMTSADVGKDKPQKGIALKPAELDAIAAYVTGYLEQKGPVTKAECEEYFGGTNPNCGSYQ
jgi:hypothetical protein